MSLSSSGPGHRPFTAETRVRLPLGMLFKKKAWPILTVVSGATLEYYAYMLFAVMVSNSAFLDQFFVADNGALKVLKGYLFFTICALCRPLGALVFGWIGDKYGRRQALFGALILMSFSCFLIAGLPTYQTAGIYAIVFLFIARVSQIISASGETNGAPIFLIEHFGPARAGLASGLAYFGTMTGSSLATVAGAYFIGDTWRYAFLIGGMAGIIAIFVRLKLRESKEFTQAAHTPAQEDLSVQKFSSYLVVLIISACASGAFYYSAMFLARCWQDLSIQSALTSTSNSTNIHSIDALRAGLVWFYAFTTFFGGMISDYFSIFKVMRIGGIGLLISIPLFLLSIAADPSFSILNAGLYAIIMLALGIFAGPSHSFMYRFFPPRSRYRAVSLCYSIATATVGSGTMPAAYFLFTKYSSPLASAFWIVPIILAAFWALNKAKKMHVDKNINSH